MTHHLYAMLLQWLKSGTDGQKRHAAFRLGQPDAINFVGQTPEYPSLATMVKNATVAAGSVVASIVHGEPIQASEEEQARRLEICHACEFFDHQQGRCTKCGCFGQWKTWLATQRCPIDKW